MKITNEMMNPEVRLTGSLIRRFLNVKSEKSFTKVQRLMWTVPHIMKTKGLQVNEQTISTTYNKNLRICTYSSPNPKQGAIGLLWMHGGGYAIGTPEQDVGFIKSFIDAANCVVISPDYRRSIDEPFPAAINDCYATLLWMKENADALGIADNRFFVGGDSAGGGLAAAVSLMARDKGDVNIVFQMPFYPMIDDKMITPSSQNNDAPIWNTRANEIAWKLYLGELFGSDEVPVYAAPARETNYAGLPPTYTFVGGLDPFLDETKIFIENLKRDGTPATVDIYEGCFHAFDLICAKSNIAKIAKQKYIEAFKYAVEKYT